MGIILGKRLLTRYEIIRKSIRRGNIMKKIDLAKLLKNYTSGWVAISSDFSRVVFAGKDVKDIRKKAKGYKDKLYFFPAGESYANFVG